MNKPLYGVVAGALGLALASCGSIPPSPAQCSLPENAAWCAAHLVDRDLVEASRTAAEALDNMLRPDGGTSVISRAQPLLVASFVNVDNVTRSSTLGRILAEQLASRFTQLGYSVAEMKLRSTVYIEREAGEYLLSRDVRDISRQHNAEAVVVGTYAVGATTVFVTSKVVRAVDGVLLASYDFMLPLGVDTRRLLYLPAK